MTYHDLFIDGIYFLCFMVLFEDKRLHVEYILSDCLITFQCLTGNVEIFQLNVENI